MTLGHYRRFIAASGIGCYRFLISTHQVCMTIPLKIIFSNNIHMPIIFYFYTSISAENFKFDYIYEFMFDAKSHDTAYMIADITVSSLAAVCM